MTSWKGPYSYTKEVVEAQVESDRAGAFILSAPSPNPGKFIPKYVGRSDGRLRAELIGYLDEKPHPDFWFAYRANADGAYQLECEGYHRFTPPENDIHPRKPVGSSVKCPVGGCEFSSTRGRQ